jgi:probable HAF family extracellular repeat protein
MRTTFNTRMATGLAILVTAILLSIDTAAFGQTGSSTYTVIDLGVNVTPSDINVNDEVVGSLATESYVTSGFYFDVVNGLSELPGTREATAINDQGEIVGSLTGGGSFLISGSSFIDFGVDHTAAGINELGQVAGSQSKKNPFRPTPLPTDAAIYDILKRKWDALDLAGVYSRGTRKGVYADLYRLTDINDFGFAVGTKSRYGLYGSSSFQLSPGSDSVTWLPIPSGGEARAINNSNQVVGRTGVIDGSYAGYLYDNGTFTDLGTLPGGTSSIAYDVNDGGQIVGSSSNIGFVWQVGVMTDLNSRLDSSSPWTITSAFAINEQGDIAASGTQNGETHGLVLVLVTDGGGGPTNAAPVASFAVNKTQGRAPLRIVFDAAGSSDSDGTIVDYAWDFGDETSASGINTKHRYRTAGVYPATLTVTDDGGLTDTTAAVEITVR